MIKNLVSIIIPIYNRAHLIIETLESIKNQTYTNWECIIIDDGSNDETIDTIENYIIKDNRFKFYLRTKDMPKGANSCRNYGFKISKGKYINWFDSDDLMLPNKLKLQVESLATTNFAFTVCQTLVFENSKDNILGLRKKKIYSNDCFNDFITNDIKWLTQAPLIKKEFLLKNNLEFDESLSQSQERDFFVKVLDNVDDYLYDMTPLVLFRKHNVSISHSLLTSAKCDSNFRVNLRILTEYRSKLTKKSVLYLKKSLKSSVKETVLLGETELTKNFLKKLFSRTKCFSFYEKIKLLSGIYAIKYLKKGEILFK